MNDGYLQHMRVGGCAGLGAMQVGMFNTVMTPSLLRKSIYRFFFVNIISQTGAFYSFGRTVIIIIAKNST
jgi:hypothetical protein